MNTEKSKQIKPTCKLSNTDGNVFHIIGRVSFCLKKAGMDSMSKEFAKNAMACEDYDGVLRLAFEYVDVE